MGGRGHDSSSDENILNSPRMSRSWMDRFLSAFISCRIRNMHLVQDDWQIQIVCIATFLIKLEFVRISYSLAKWRFLELWNGHIDWFTWFMSTSFIKIWRCWQFLLNMWFFWCPFLDPHQTIHHSYKERMCYYLTLSNTYSWLLCGLVSMKEQTPKDTCVKEIGQRLQIWLTTPHQWTGITNR